MSDDIRRSALEKLPAALKALYVAFGDLVDLSEAMMKDRTKIKPKVRAKGELERAIRKLTFLDGFRLSGSTGPAGTRSCADSSGSHVPTHHKVELIGHLSNSDFPGLDADGDRSVGPRP